MLEPENRLKSVSEICGLVPCDRKTYYKAFAKPEFKDMVAEMSKDITVRHVTQVVNAFVKQAVRGSHQHGKVILEMAGVYTEKVRQEHTGKDGAPIEVKRDVDLSNLTDEELNVLEKLITSRNTAPDA